MTREIYCALVVRKWYYTLPLPITGVMNLHYATMKISWDQADIIAKFPLLLHFLISQLGVNVLVKGSLLIRVLTWLTNPNPIQWTFYTANIVCRLHDHIGFLSEYPALSPR